MKIAVLAWGSVVWERGVLEVAADFMPNGPHLPVEFCRVSGGERLTLVIDETLGATCPTYAAPSSFGDSLVLAHEARVAGDCRRRGLRRDGGRRSLFGHPGLAHAFENGLEGF